MNMLRKSSPTNFNLLLKFAAVIFTCALFSLSVFAQEPSSETRIPAKKVDNAPKTRSAELPDEPPPVAPDFEAPARPLPGAERVGVEVANQLPMTLEESIEMALQNNNDIETSKIDVRIAEFNLRSTRGVFDPRLETDSYFERATTPVASVIGGAVNGSLTATRYFGSASVNGFSPYFGASYSANFSSSRLSTSNTNATLNPQFPSALSFTYVQPLFRGKHTDLNRRNIEIAKKNLSLSDSQFRQQAIDVISQVEQSYWDLVFSLRNLQVQLDAVKQARLQLESNQRLVAKGVLPPIDIVAANTQIAIFEQNVYTAQENVTKAENTLKTLMLPDRASEIWSRPITPVSSISLNPPRVGLEIAVADALKNRPEIAQFEMSSEINEIDRKFYKDQTKPQIDLYGTYTTQGLAGSVPPGRTVPANLAGGYFTSLGNLAAQDYPTFRAGITISLPWGNNIAEANLGRTLAQGDRIKNQRAQAEQIIEAQVRNALQSLRSAEARLNASIAARTSAEQLFESEQRQFRSGTTTFYLVSQRQTDLIAARGRELQAQTDLNKAISAFQRATGTTLSANNVSVTEGANLVRSTRRLNIATRNLFETTENR